MIDKLDADIKTAMLAGESDKVTLLRGLKSSLGNERIKLGHDLSEDEILTVFKREVKQRDESAALYNQGGAADKAQRELAEKALIEKYLPAMMPEAEIEALADEVIAQVGADSKQTGTIIGQVMARAKGAADGRQVAEIVKRKLS